jgi:hypothetical protein
VLVLNNIHIKTRIDVEDLSLASSFSSISENCKCIVVCMERSTAGKGRRSSFTNDSEEMQTLFHNFLLFYSSYMFRLSWTAIIRQLRYTARKKIQVKPVRMTLIQLAKMSTSKKKVMYGETV